MYDRTLKREKILIIKSNRNNFWRKCL